MKESADFDGMLVNRSRMMFNVRTICCAKPRHGENACEIAGGYALTLCVVLRKKREDGSWRIVCSVLKSGKHEKRSCAI